LPYCLLTSLAEVHKMIDRCSKNGDPFRATQRIGLYVIILLGAGCSLDFSITSSCLVAALVRYCSCRLCLCVSLCVCDNGGVLYHRTDSVGLMYSVHCTA